MVWVKGYSHDLTINHINGNRLDNRAKNLEWLTLAENIRHGFETGLYSSNQKRVSLKDLRNGDMKTFDSMAQASRFLGKECKFVSNRIRRNKLRVNHMEIIDISN